MELRKHRWGLYFAVEDFSKPRPKRGLHDGIDLNLLKDIRPVSIDSIKLFVTVHGMIADVTCQASFTNTESDHVDGFFLFPVDSEAALYHFEASVRGRKIVAATREKGENHELSLLEELDGEGILLEDASGDMFTCHIGVVPMDEQVDVMFQYSIELMISPEGNVPFVFPSFVPREFQAKYMDTAIGQNGQHSYNVDEYSFDFYFQAIIAGNYMIKDVLSREVLEIDYLDQTRYNAKLTLAGSYLPNRDFAFTMKYADIESPHILVQKGGPEASSDHVVMTNQCGLFTLFHRLNKARPKSTKGEYIFCVDRSPGMRGYKMQLARETLLYFIKGLPVGCYFNIISFGALAQPLFKSSRVYNQYNVMKAIKCQLKMRADMAGHNVLGLLEHVYGQPLIAGHPKQVFIITEGSVSNKHECVEFVSQRAEYARLFPIGIGAGCERAMITGLARAGSGKPHFLKVQEKPYNTVLECLKQAMQPGLTDLLMEFDTPAGVTCLTIPPTIPPIVFAEEKLQIYILIRGQPEDPADSSCSLTLSGRLGKDEPYSNTIYFNLSESMMNDNLPIHRLALKTEINDLERSIATALGADDILENEYHIIQASLGANIASRFSPLVGIDAVTGQEVEGFPIIRVKPEEISLGRAAAAAPPGSVYKSMSRLTLSRPGETPSAFVRGIFERQSGGQRTTYSMADSRRLGHNAVHDFDDEVEDGLEMEYTFKRPPAAVADIDSELALSEIYMGVSDKDEWDRFKDSLKHPGGLTKFQHSDGYWMLDKKIAYAFSSTITEVKNENPLRDDLVWTTILALNFLKTNFPIRKTEWKEAEDWARGWLYQQDLEGYSLDELLELAFGLKHLNGEALFKPPTRPQHEISTIEEDESEHSQPSSTPAEPVTYMRQESITMIERGIDDMAEDEYVDDAVQDIKTTAVEISATAQANGKAGRSEDATKDHPGHLTIISPSQHRDPPGVSTKGLERVGSIRHHHSTAQRQQSINLGQQTAQGEMRMGRYGEVVATPPTFNQSSKRPQPLKRSSFQSLSPSSSTGREVQQSLLPQSSGSEPTRIQQSQSFNLSDRPSQFQRGELDRMSERVRPSPPAPRERASMNSLYRNGQPDEPTAFTSQFQPPGRPFHPVNQSNHPTGQSVQSEALMHHRTPTDHSRPQVLPRPLNSHSLEGTTHYSPLQPDVPLPSPRERPQGGGMQTPAALEPTLSAPASSTNLSGFQRGVSGQSAPRPNELRLQHTTSTDIMIDESLEEPSCEPAPEPVTIESPPPPTQVNKPKQSESWPSAASTSRLSLRSAASTSYALPKSNTFSTADTQKPKRSLSFKQRMKNLKDNLMYAADIKYCRKHSDLTRMNSLRSSIRSGRSPYALDYDETDVLISANNSKRRTPRSSKDRSRSSRPAVTDGRSRTVTPESRSRPTTPSSRSRPASPDSDMRPTTPLLKSRPASPERPVAAARSRPASPELWSPEGKSRPTTPVFRQGGKAPGANYFRPRTPSAAVAEASDNSSHFESAPNFSSLTNSQAHFSHGVGRLDTALLIRPVPQQGAAASLSYQDSPRSSYRSQQTLL